MDSSKIEQYIRAHTTSESSHIQELMEASDDELEFVDMMSGRMVGRLLALLIKLSGARRVLEVGTFTGYSALSMAEAMPMEGKIYTCEYNERYEDIARRFFEESSHGSKIKLVMGKALETVPDIPGKFDFIFLDADKINYPDYYNLLLPRLNEGGLMVIDNVLWDGKVLDPQTDKAKAIDKLNARISEDESVEQVMLPVRDGVTIVRKR
ncbi:MAG TPA: O-methyltransferase [Fodinibius sp.]|nr:O-methyltransferase [Fodinibius sp.]